MKTILTLPFPCTCPHLPIYVRNPRQLLQSPTSIQRSLSSILVSPSTVSYAVMVSISDTSPSQISQEAFEKVTQENARLSRRVDELVAQVSALIQQSKHTVVDPITPLHSPTSPPANTTTNSPPKPPPNIPISSLPPE